MPSFTLRELLLFILRGAVTKLLYLLLKLTHGTSFLGSVIFTKQIRAGAAFFNVWSASVPRERVVTTRVLHLLTMI